MIKVWDNLSKEWWGEFETEEEALDAIYKGFIDTIDLLLDDTDDPEKIADLESDKADMQSRRFGISGSGYGDFELVEE